MSACGIEGITFQASHPPEDPLRRVWVAVDDEGHAVAAFVAYQPAPGEVAFDRGAYTVECMRRRGIATQLARHAIEALAAEDPPLTLYYFQTATPGGHRVAERAGAKPFPKRAASLAENGIEYEPFNEADAIAEGLDALRAAAERLGLPAPEP
ncbi:GNAT family N-acetyltransferase [Nocardia abscessus]|uniref:GNAT family N-acetyltransferase n=1 Tax=Nocardia abscessus TaxID=120957 RepID=UPI001894AC29|nr:GNAT family N-acetyltransferase [Nocardia abscessus]MBF6340830.1 GNAT family N-acetyltransferase [Nocardia abscessus]